MNTFEDSNRIRRRINLSMLLIIVVFLTGCASGTGANLNNYFKTDIATPLVTSIRTDQASKPIILGPTLKSDSDNFIASLALGGIVGAYFSTNSAAWSAIRGKYAASEAFVDATKRFNSGDTKKEVILRLDRFEYGIRPAKGFKSGGILSYMEFSSQFSNNDNKVWSAYACDFQIKGTFFPNDEKNMLREMMEASLWHWATLISSPDNMEIFRAGSFPQKFKGDFMGDEAKCIYEVFVSEQERSMKLKKQYENGIR